MLLHRAAFILLATTVVVSLASDTALAKDRKSQTMGSYGRVGLGAGVGQDLAGPGLRPLLGPAFVGAVGFQFLPKLSLEISLDALGGYDVLGGGGGPITHGGLNFGARVSLDRQLRGLFTFGGIGPAFGMDENGAEMSGAGLTLGVGWKDSPSRSDGSGVLGQYSPRVMGGEAVGFVHTFVIAGFIYFDL